MKTCFLSFLDRVWQDPCFYGMLAKSFSGCSKNKEAFDVSELITQFSFWTDSDLQSQSPQRFRWGFGWKCRSTTAAALVTRATARGSAATSRGVAGSTARRGATACTAAGATVAAGGAGVATSVVASARCVGGDAGFVHAALGLHSGTDADPQLARAPGGPEVEGVRVAARVPRHVALSAWLSDWFPDCEGETLQG